MSRKSVAAVVVPVGARSLVIRAMAVSRPFSLSSHDNPASIQ